MNTNSDLPENRPQDSSAEAASTPASASAADQTAPVGQPAPAVTAPTEQVSAPAASTATETTAEAKPRRRIGKRTWIIGGAVAGVLVLGGAGFAIADELNDGADSLDDATRDRVASAATAYTGGGELIDAERDDDGGYDAEVRLENGREVDLDLDENFAVISSDTDRIDGDDDRKGDDDVSDDQDADDQGSGASTAPTTGTGDDARIDDDTPLTADETSAAAEAALAEVGQGEVVDIDRSDDRDHAFDVEVRLTDGTEVEVDLDADFGVVRTSPSD